MALPIRGPSSGVLKELKSDSCWSGTLLLDVGEGVACAVALPKEVSEDDCRFGTPLSDRDEGSGTELVGEGIPVLIKKRGANRKPEKGKPSPATRRETSKKERTVTTVVAA